MLNPEWNIAAGAINMTGCALYMWDTIKGRVKPNRVGWSLWTIAPLIAFAAEVTQGVSWAALITLASGLGPLMILLASFASKKAYWKLRPFDWYCGALSVVALVLWGITGKGNVAILFSICADLLACLPTLVKAWRRPETESGVPFWAGTLGVIIALLTVDQWTFANYAFPVYLLVANTAVALVIELRGHRRLLRLRKRRVA